MRKLFAALATVVALLVPTQALAAPPTPAPTSWAVQPGNSSGPDGRAWVEAEVKAGSSYKDFMVVRNLGRLKTIFKLNAADGYFTDKGRFNMLTSDKTSVDAGRWISVASTVTVDAGAQRVVPFTVTVPKNTVPGDHAAGLAATIATTGTDQDGNKMGVESRVGFRVMVRVKGEISPALQVAATVENQLNFNPVAAGKAVVDVSLANSGNARLATGGTIEVSGPFGLGKVEVPLPPVDDTLPGTTHSQHVEVTGVWPLFLTTARVTVHPVAVQGQSLPVLPRTETVSITTVAIPWGQLGLLILLAALALSYLLVSRRRRSRLQDMMRRAHQEGRREALDAMQASMSAKAFTLWVALVTSAMLFVPSSPPSRGPNDIDIGVEIVARTPTASPISTISPSLPKPTLTQSATPAPAAPLPETGTPTGTIAVVASVLIALASALLVLNRRKGRRS